MECEKKHPRSEVIMIMDFRTEFFQIRAKQIYFLLWFNALM